MGERTFNSSGFGIALRDPSTGRDLLPPGGSVLGPVRSWDARVSARMNVIDVAALLRVRAASAAVTAMRAEALDASHQAAAIAAMAYIRVLRAQAHIAARQTDSTLAEDLLGIARDQRAAGLGTELDEARARTQVTAMRAQLIEARAERDKALFELRRALGLQLDAPLTLADSLPSTRTLGSEPDEKEVTDISLRHRADLQTLKAQVDVARRQASAVNAERFPALSVVGDYGSSGNATSRLLSTYAWGAELSVPVFDGLRREGRIAAQRSAGRELEIRRRDLVEQIKVEVRESLVELASAQEQIVASEERLQFARQTLAQARDRLTAGMTGNSEVVTALMAVNEALAAWVDARAAYQTARVGARRVEGSVTELP
jgi:outer membrane protein TolC